MLESILIANRGEIARRIIRTARRLGVRSVAVYSEADRDALYTREADQALPIGGAAPRDSYLNQGGILEAARASGAAAIHPGYGFLSENAEFAAAVQAAGLTWVGAPPAAIRAMGLKDAAKALMSAAGVPVTPGYSGADQEPLRLAAEADHIGYPVMIKAVAGGGGKGMRRVANRDEFPAQLEACRREAQAAFGNDRVLLERCIDAPRHIEVQVFGDTHGSIVHLYERDCSVQRRHQKIIEEAPAPGMDAATRAALCGAAVAAAKTIDYVGAGTVEFIADVSTGLRSDRIWFMEMNTRLQVEHAVTEAVTGQDLVEWQLRVASGERLPLTQDEIKIDGCAIEARLYAENPANGFLPSTGRLAHLRLPADLRVDSGVVAGDTVSGHYDPMLAKLIAHAVDRAAAARQLARACRDVEIWPVHSNAALLARILGDPVFLSGGVDTGYVERGGTALADPGPDPALIEAAGCALLPAAESANPWQALLGFRTAAAPYREVEVEIDGKPHRVDCVSGATPPRTMRLGNDLVLFRDGEAWSIRAPAAGRTRLDPTRADGALRAPMPGRIVSVAVAAGETVTPGQRLVVLEAMKMEHAMVAPFAGTVELLAVAEGDQVAEGVVLVRIAREA